jgi:hypothetical protein
MMVEVKVAWARVWLDLCTNQVVSARACAYHFLTSNSAVINLLGKRTVQADGCLQSEQIDTLFISVGVQEGGLGGEAFWAGGPKFTKNLHVTVRNLFLASF